VGLLFAAAVMVPAAPPEPQAERGKYLVEEVAQCGACHTPMGEDGQPDRAKWLKGGALVFQPVKPIEKWHGAAPDLTASGRLWQRWGEKGLVNFLQTGLGPSGNRADPPMPLYKMRAEDAEAIVAYLKTLR
jgi:mono/diheme cytochrome c family protein